MIRENVLEYFEDGREENFRWLRGIFSSQKLCDFNLRFLTRNPGKLHLPTGKIVASDPTVFFDEKPFVIKVEKGSYDVILSIARISYEYDRSNLKDERVAFAMLRLNENVPVRWEPAVRENDDISKSSEGKFFGYGVDSGTGCFMDVESQKILNELYFDEELNFGDIIYRAQEKNRLTTWDWLNYDFEGLPNNNFITFSSGWGDGGYASYFGFDENNQPACLITDFEVVRDSDEEIL